MNKITNAIGISILAISAGIVISLIPQAALATIGKIALYATAAMTIMSAHYSTKKI